MFVEKSCNGEIIFIDAGAFILTALYRFNLPAPDCKSHPEGAISSDVDFRICLTSSGEKVFNDKIKAAAALTRGAAAEFH